MGHPSIFGEHLSSTKLEIIIKVSIFDAEEETQAASAVPRL